MIKIMQIQKKTSNEIREMENPVMHAEEEGCLVSRKKFSLF